MAPDPTEEELRMQEEITGLLDRIEDLLSAVREHITEEPGGESDDTDR